MTTFFHPSLYDDSAPVPSYWEATAPACDLEHRLLEADESCEVAIIGRDYPGLRPKMHVAPGDRVRQGQLLVTDARNRSLRLTAPAPGRIKAVNRGKRRRLESVVGRAYTYLPGWSPDLDAWNHLSRARGFADLDDELPSELRESVKRKAARSLSRTYSQFVRTGFGGVEGGMDDVLSGRPGLRWVERDKRAQQIIDEARMTQYVSAFGFGQRLPFDLPVTPSPADVPDSRLERARTRTV